MEDDYVYLLKNGKDIMQDIPSDSYVDDYNEKYDIPDIVDKRKYEQAVSKFKKLKTFIKAVVGRNSIAPSEQ